jgi:WD40 repeat protein
MTVPCPFCGQDLPSVPAPGAAVRCPRCFLRLTPDDFIVQPRVLIGHSGPIAAVALAPAGRYALSGATDATVRLWDLAAAPGTDPAVRVCAGHTAAVAAVAFTPDGDYAVSGAEDHTLRLWDLAGGTTLRPCHGHSGAVYTVAVTPDGRHALSGGQDTSLILWNLRTGQAVRTLQGHRRQVYAVAIRPDGQRALSAGADDRLCLWDLGSGQRLWTGAWSPTYHDPDAFSYDNLWAVAFTADGQGAVTGAETVLHRWDFSAGGPQHTIETYDTIGTLALSPDGRYAFVGHAAGVIKVWDLAGPPEGAPARRTLRANLGGVFSLALRADGRGLLAGGADNYLRAWTLPARFLA